MIGQLVSQKSLKIPSSPYSNQRWIKLIRHCFKSFPLTLKTHTSTSCGLRGSLLLTRLAGWLIGGDLPFWLAMISTLVAAYLLIETKMATGWVENASLMRSCRKIYAVLDSSRKIRWQPGKCSLTTWSLPQISKSTWFTGQSQDSWSTVCKVSARRSRSL